MINLEKCVTVPRGAHVLRVKKCLGCDELPTVRRGNKVSVARKYRWMLSCQCGKARGGNTAKELQTNWNKAN